MHDVYCWLKEAIMHWDWFSSQSASCALVLYFFCLRLFCTIEWVVLNGIYNALLKITAMICFKQQNWYDVKQNIKHFDWKSFVETVYLKSASYKGIFARKCCYFFSLSFLEIGKESLTVLHFLGCYKRRGRQCCFPWKF